MIRKNLCAAAVLFFIFITVNISAAVPVAVIPFEGDENSAAGITASVKSMLGKSSGIAVVADSMMKDIMDIHEKAQVMGSSSHDLTKIKVAQFIITGNVSGKILQLRAVDVNSGTEVYNQPVDLSRGNYVLSGAVREMSDKILFTSSAKGEEVPEEAKPYMGLVNRLVSSLGNGDEACYDYIAVYWKGSYKHPVPKDKKLKEKAGQFLKFMKRDFIRSKIYYISMKTESFWVYIDVVAEKTGKKKKYRFGILELDDGSLGVGVYEEMK